jgi:hypothetical protein
VKSKKLEDLHDDLKETFDNLRKYKMMLNPKNACSEYHQANCSATWYQLEDRRKSKEGGGHRTITTTSNPKKNPEIGRHDGST